jgi:PAS domain S-box-containing protein
MFGYAHEAFIGRSVEDLVPHSYRRVHPAYRIGFLTSTRKREMGYHPPIFALRADGKEIEIKVALTASPDDDTVMAVCRQFAEWDALKADNPEDAAPQRRPERG